MLWGMNSTLLRSCSQAYSLCILQVDTDTYDLLRSLNMANLPGVKQAQVRALRIATTPVSRLYVRWGSAHVSLLASCAAGDTMPGGMAFSNPCHHKAPHRWQLAG